MRASGVPRNDIFLTTKVSHEHLKPDDFARSVDASLAALKVDYIDLLLIHWPSPDINLSETMPALAKAKQQGKARHVGPVANFNIGLLDKAVEICPEPLVALQAEYHPYLDQTKLLAAARRHKLAFVAYCPLGRGKLIDDPVLNDIAKARGRTFAHFWQKHSRAMDYRFSNRKLCGSPPLSPHPRSRTNGPAFSCAHNCGNLPCDKSHGGQ